MILCAAMLLRGSARDLVVGVALSACFAACSASSGSPNDAGRDTVIVIDALARMDTGSPDRADGTAGADARDSAADKVDTASDPTDTAADTHDSGSGGATGAGGSVDAGMGGAGMGGSSAGGSGMGGSAGAGMGGAAGSSMGGSGAGGVAGAGMGGADAGIDAPDSAPGGNTGSIDSGIDTPPSSDASDGPTCGTGCPANVRPGSLVLWLSADVGVTCDQLSTPPRVTGWKDRRANSTVTLTPVAQKPGPRCDGQTLSGITLPYFDRTTTDVDTGILRVDLTPLNGSNYTVFVVERRRSSDARYVLGTDVPFPASVDCLNDNAHLAYRFGYRSPVLFGAGSYTSNVDEDCADPSVTVPTFSTAQAMLEVERFESGVEHKMTIGSSSNLSDDTDPMGGLLQGYLGRAFQLAFGSDSRYLGEVAEVVIYGAALDQTDIDAVSSYLRSRWGL